MRQCFVAVKQTVGNVLCRCGPLGRWIYRQVASSERAFTKIWPVVNSVEGFLVSPIQERWFFETALSLPDGANIVEIGSFKGRSTCCLAFGCKGTSKKCFAVDTFRGNSSDFKHEPYFDKFWSNIQKIGLSSYVTPVQGLSSEVAKTWSKPIHLLYIDGSHQYDDVLADFEGFFPHVVEGGIVAFHDVIETWPGPLRVWREVAAPLLKEKGICSTLAFGRKP